MRGVCRRIGSGDDRGAIALEFAIVAPLLLILIFGMLEFGLMYNAQLALTHAAREGARLASVADGSLWDRDVVEDRAFPLTGARLYISDPPTETEDSVIVRVEYQWVWETPLFQILTPLDPPLLEAVATMRKE